MGGAFKALSHRAARRRRRRLRRGGRGGCRTALFAGLVAGGTPLLITLIGTHGRVSDDAVAIFGVIGLIAAGAALLAERQSESARRGARSGAWRQLQLEQERAVLVAAQQHDGRVTPADVAACADDLSLAEARDLLDDLAAEGLCVAEPQVGGPTVYNFRQGAESWTLAGSPSIPSEREQQLARERAVIEVAARNGGRVTPVLAAAASRDLSLSEARDLLDGLAKHGLCAFESDDRGAVYYDFNLGTVDASREPASPEEWVAQRTARMAGTDDDPEVLTDLTG